MNNGRAHKDVRREMKSARKQEQKELREYEIEHTEVAADTRQDVPLEAERGYLREQVQAPRVRDLG